jgi:hypothetical protein
MGECFDADGSLKPIDYCWRVVVCHSSMSVCVWVSDLNNSRNWFGFTLFSQVLFFIHCAICFFFSFDNDWNVMKRNLIKKMDIIYFFYIFYHFSFS